MTNTNIFLFTLLVFIISDSITQGNVVCSTFGNDLKSLTPSSSTKSGLFLMQNATAGCPGNATMWNVCYYNSSTDQRSTVTFGVYHSSFPASNYTLITGSAMTYNVSRNGSNYTCIHFPISLSQQFTVQPGDLIAACVQNSKSSFLNIFGTFTTQQNAYTLLQPSSSCNASLQSKINLASTTAKGLITVMHVSLDINECAVKNGGCTQVCNDVAMGSNCSCFPGYQLGANNTSCNDINECTLGTDSCSQVCNNTIGSYMCSCQLGYYLAADNMTCLDIDECTVKNTCSQVCSNTNGSYLCSCQAGYLFASNSITCVAAQQTSSNAAYGAIVVIFLLPLAAIIIFVVCFVYVKRRGKYNMQHKEFENMTYNSAAGVLKNTPDNVHAYEDLNITKLPSVEIQNAQCYEVPNYAVPDETLFSDANAASEVVSYSCPADCEDELYAQLKEHGIRNIPKQEIQTRKDLGHGRFGDVHSGVWRRSGGIIEVALKTLNLTTSPKDAKVKLLQEAAVMAQFRHPNVILLHGVVIEQQNLMLVIELALKGDLRSHLVAMKPTSPGETMSSDTPKTLLRYSQQVALGMQYLSNKSFVHRDLAARNVLVTKDDICKIADFGMSRDLSDTNYYVSHGGAIPVKWTAPEAVLYKKYSSESDIWSYGCLLYEIWSIGCKPFEKLTNTDVISKVELGYRLPPPPGCPLVVYEIMIQCWNPEAHSRPAFRDLHLSLTQYEDHVLKVPDEASATHPQAGIIGAPLEAGSNMYTDLQYKYL